MEAIEGQFFHPNMLFLPVDPNKLNKTDLEQIFDTADETRSGVCIFDKDKDIALGSEKDVHVWLPDSALEGDFYDNRVFDLAMLSAFRIQRNWVGNVSLWMPTDEDKEKEAEKYLDRLKYEARFPAATNINVTTDTLNQSIRAAPKGDLHIIPVVDLKDMRDKMKTTKNIKRTFLFVKDSGNEDILA